MDFWIENNIGQPYRSINFAKRNHRKEIHLGMEYCLKYAFIQNMRRQKRKMECSDIVPYFKEK